MFDINWKTDFVTGQNVDKRRVGTEPSLINTLSGLPYLATSSRGFVGLHCIPGSVGHQLITCLTSGIHTVGISLLWDWISAEDKLSTSGVEYAVRYDYKQIAYSPSILLLQFSRVALISLRYPP